MILVRKIMRSIKEDLRKYGVKKGEERGVIDLEISRYLEKQ